MNLGNKIVAGLVGVGCLAGLGLMIQNPVAKVDTTSPARVGDSVSVRAFALGCPQELATGMMYYVQSNKYSGKSDLTLVQEWTAIQRSKCAIFPARERGTVKEILPESAWSSAVYCIKPDGWSNCVWFDRRDFSVTPKEIKI